ncbi:MAG: hypothetical protein NVS4B11_02170 [Ktedonobacteraceae bacterium]
MSAAMSTTQTAMTACRSCAQGMPFSQFSMPAMYTMHMAAASMLIIGTGAVASVSLFVVVLLVSLVVVISLLLTCLTRLISLESLVGQTEEMVGLATYITCVKQGD